MFGGGFGAGLMEPERLGNPAQAEYLCPGEEAIFLRFGAVGAAGRRVAHAQAKWQHHCNVHLAACWRGLACVRPALAVITRSDRCVESWARTAMCASRRRPVNTPTRTRIHTHARPALPFAPKLILTSRSLSRRPGRPQ